MEGDVGVGDLIIERWCWRLGDQDVGVEDSEGRVITSSIKRGQYFHILRTFLSETLRRGFTCHRKKAPNLGPLAARACSPCVDIAGHSCCTNEGLESHCKKMPKVGKWDLRLTKWAS